MNVMPKVSHLPKWEYLFEKLFKNDKLLSEYSEVRSLLLMLCVFEKIEDDEHRSLDTFCENHKILSIIWAISEQSKIKDLNNLSISEFESENDLLVMILNNWTNDELINFIKNYYSFFEADVNALINQFAKTPKNKQSKESLITSLNEKIWHFKKQLDICEVVVWNNSGNIINILK